MAQQFTEFSLSHIFPVEPEEIYKAWLNGDLHAAMTGGHAECTAEEGKSFNAWDGYISGINLKLIPNKKIIQSWRTTEFKDDDQNSEIEIDLKGVDNGCLFILSHRTIPAGQPDYKQGWNEHYIKPMSEYFKW